MTFKGKKYRKLRVGTLLKRGDRYLEADGKLYATEFIGTNLEQVLIEVNGDYYRPIEKGKR